MMRRELEPMKTADKTGPQKFENMSSKSTIARAFCPHIYNPTLPSPESRSPNPHPHIPFRLVPAVQGQRPCILSNQLCRCTQPKGLAGVIARVL